MTMEITKTKTPAGNACVRMHSSGEVTASDAEQMNQLLAPGTEFHDLAILATVESGAKFSPEARQAFTKGNAANAGNGAEAKPVAIVVNSAPLRVLLSFIVRMSSASANTRFFGNEADAMAFLDERLAPSTLGKAG